MAAEYHSPIKLGSISTEDKLGSSLHLSALNGSRKKIKKAIEKGIHVDFPNDLGQSPLFCSCYENHDKATELLLEFGANPNERCNVGITPVHVAAYTGNIKILTELLADGGDLRLHDNNGRTAKDWALMQPDPKKRLRMIEFLEKTRLFALTKSGQDVRISAETSHHDRRISGLTRNNSIVRIIRDRIKGESAINLEHLKSSHSMGYGKVYLDHESTGGIVSTIPLISENFLKHDSKRVTYDNGAFSVMQSMMWRKTKVTAKRLHRDTDPGGEVDLLIKESDYMGRARHPNILLLMGICQTDNLDGLVLIYENVDMGSLFYFLHTKLEKLSTNQVQEMTYQIADAVQFLHSQNLLHCYITSHAVNIINPHLAKLGNFEYMIDRNKAKLGRASVVYRNIYQCAAYNWMAPEIMNKCPPSQSSDMYSFSAVVWEMLHSEIPWNQYETERVREKLLEHREPLQVNKKQVPEIYRAILDFGLQMDPLHRSLNFGHILDILTMSPEEINTYVDKAVKPKRPKSSPLPDREHVKAKIKPNIKSKDFETYQGNFETGLDMQNDGRKIKPERMRKQEQKKASSNEYNCDCNQNGDMNAEKLCNRNQQMRFVDNMNFTHRNIDWNLQEEQQGDEYYYSIGVKPADITENYSLCHVKENGGCVSAQSDEETCTSSQDQLSQDSQLNDHGLERPMTTRFSYLQVQQSASPPGACTIKPASHCTAPNVEKPMEKQLTTAGSIYALYNMTSTDDLYTPCRPKGLLKTPASTMPRKRKRNEATPEIRPRSHLLKGDKDWFGGKGSVKDLVALYQNQVFEHKQKQDVLEGKLDQHATDPQAGHARKIDFNHMENQHKTSPIYPNLNQDGLVTNSSSLTTVSPEGVTNTSSVESAILEKWVSKEVHKVQSSLSDEVFGVLNSMKEEECSCSPLLFEEDENLGPQKEMKLSPENTHKKCPLRNKTNNIKQRKCKQDSEVEEFYFDDDLQCKKIQEESHMKLQGLERLKQNSDLRSSFHNIATTVTKQSYRQSPKAKKDGNKRNCLLSGPRLMPATSMLHYEKLKNKATEKGVYQSTVTIKTSSAEPDRHIVTHTLTDLMDGTTSTLYGKEVKANKIASSLFSYT